ncbi:MAG TPA: P-loop NTPase fold protein, partial [Streptosporangiaceae bacterium]|nr:P-loop NTPase fold protein [Streptosporangiaceae bacterium]
TSGTDGTVRRWLASSGAPIGRPGVGHDGNSWAITAWVTPDGEPALASVGADGIIRLWRAASGEPIGQLMAGENGARALVAWSAPDGRPGLASVGVDGKIRRWDLISGELLGPPLPGHDGSGRSIACWTAPGGEPILASAGSDGTVRCWDPVAGIAFGRPLTGHVGAVRAVVSVSVLDRSMLASAGSDGTVRCWDPVAGIAVGRPLTGHDGTVQVLTSWPRPDGTPGLASGGTDGQIMLWNLAQDPANTISHNISADQGAIWAIAACPGSDGNTILVSCGDRDIRRWDAATGDGLGEPIAGHTVELRALTTWQTPTGERRLATAGDALTVHRWNPDSGQAIGEPMTGHTGPIRAAIAWTGTDGRPVLATAGDDLTIRRWDAGTGQPVGEPITGHHGPICAITAWTGTDGRQMLATAASDSTIRRWDARTGQPVVSEPMTGHTGPVRAITTWTGSDGRQMLATAGDDLTVRRWDAGTGQPVGEPMTGHTGPVCAITAWTGTDGRKMLATAASDGTIRRWNCVSGAAVGSPMPGHGGKVAAIGAWVTAAGQHALASAGEDRTIRRWDALTGQPIGEPLEGHTDPVHAITIWADPGHSPTLASAGDGTIRLWNLESGAAIRRIDVGSVRVWGLSDQAALVDLLDRESLAAAIADQLYRPDQAVRDGGPNVVTIEGPWGSGKTTLLEMVQKRLPPAKPAMPTRRHFTVHQAFGELRRARQPAADQPADGSPRAALSVWFYPWMHQSGGQVWAGLTRSIIDAVNDTLLADARTRHQFWFRRNISKVDRQTLRRALFLRTVPALLRISLIVVAAPVLISLGQLNQSLDIGKLKATTAVIAFFFSLILVAGGLAEWLRRYLAGDVTVYLPAELFEGPVVSGPLAEPASLSLGEGSGELRDPLFRARSGTLYLYQHDTRELLEHVKTAGYDVVIFIDDLDRCTANTTANVFEAVNLFLSDPRLSGRFVMGFDPMVVAAHMDVFYKDLLESGWTTHGDDPGLGWAFLRKLVQLPVLVPSISASGVKKFIDLVLRGGPDESDRDFSPAPVTTPEVQHAPVPEQQATSKSSVPLPPASQPVLPASAGNLTAGVVAATVPLEASPEVSALIEERLAAQPDLTIREAKRLVNVWQLYARLLDQVDPPLDSVSPVARGCHLVILAEIITRWPAVLLNRGRTGRGLSWLASASQNDSDWQQCRIGLGLDESKYDSAVGNLRRLLLDYDGTSVAQLAELLL